MMAIIDDLRELVRLDQNSGSHRFPEQTQFIIDDEKFSGLLIARFEHGERLQRVYELDYQVSLGLIPIVFEMSPTNDQLPRLSDILVLVSGSCRVAAICEHFDKRQPNSMYPPIGPEDRLPKPQGHLPFVISRPSVTLGFPDLADALVSYQDRIRQFLDRLGLREPATPQGKETACVLSTDIYTAGGVWDTRADRIADDSGV